MANEIIVFVTCQAQSAEHIAKSIITQKLAACVNIIPAIKSVFQWQKEISIENESFLIIKSNRSKWKELEAGIKMLHTYDIPEIICFSIEEGYPPYLDWLNACLK